MSDLLTRSSHSLILQSFKSREREEPLNGDGFGVGWYAHELDLNPGLFTSVRPAWANRNLLRLAPKIRSGCFFAHVRAASPGSPVTELNCHPFQAGRFLWMHNGHIAGFKRLRRHLREFLCDEAYDEICGTTDSEHAFALFLHFLRKHREDYELENLQRALRDTIRKIDRLAADIDASGPSELNFALTDGQNLLATRYTTDPGVKPQTLYVAQGERLEVQDGHYRMIRGGQATDAVIIASEPLTDAMDDWHCVPSNHMVSVSPELHVRMEAL